MKSPQSPEIPEYYYDPTIAATIADVTCNHYESLFPYFELPRHVESPVHSNFSFNLPRNSYFPLSLSTTQSSQYTDDEEWSAKVIFYDFHKDVANRLATEERRKDGIL